MGLLPGYMRSNPDGWLQPTIESCCKRYYPWVSSSECLVATSGDPLAITGSFKWYVYGGVCKQDCAAELSGTCGGFADNWNELFDSASACCAEKLPWVYTPICLARSTNSDVDGTNQWFVDYTIVKCVKDCDDSSDRDCGGVSSPWNQLYSSVSECCSELGYIERSE